MAATLTLSKIEIGFQYTTSSTEGIIDSKGAVGHANTDISYYPSDTASSGDQITGAGYGDINMESFDSFDIVLGLEGSSLTYYPIQHITPSINKRTTITPADSHAADVKPYYNNGRYTNPIFTLNADDNNIMQGTTLYLFPLIDITFNVSGDDGSFMSKEKDFVYLENKYIHSLERNEIVKGPDNYTISSTKYLSDAIYNDNYPFVLISSADNTKKFPGVFDPNLNASLDGVYQISGLFFDRGYIDMENWIGNISAYARLGRGSDSDLYSYQGVCSIIKSNEFNERVSQFTIRCVSPTYMASVEVPAAIYTGQATATVTLPIERTSDIYSSAASSGTQRNIQFTVTRNQLASSTVMPYNISISNPGIYNRVYTKVLSSSDTATEFTLQDIGSHQELDNTRYANYKNLIYTPAEKIDIAYYDINNNMSLTTKYGDTLLRLCKKNSDYYPDKDFIYEYFLYYKPSISDIQSSSTEFIKRIILESISVKYNTQDLKNFEQLSVTCYWFPNARKLAEGISLSGGGNPSTASTVRDSITIANNALMSYPIGTDAMLGYSNYYLRLADLSDTAWHNFANANLQYTYTHRSDDSATGTMQFNLSDAFDSSVGMQDMYSDYNAFLTSLRVQFYNNVIDDDNILFTSIPMLIRVKTITKGKDEYNEVYLIKIIVDLRKLRNEKINDLKLLSNSDFVKSGYFRSTYDSNPDSSSRLFTNLYLDNSADSDVSNKVMSSIDIINKNLYVFDPEGKRIKTITQDDIIDIEGSNVQYNTVINYADMYNIANANSTSAVVGSRNLQFVIEDSSTHNWISADECQYIAALPNENISLFSSVFNSNHPVNSYKLCTENFDPNAGLILEDSAKGYGISLLASISKDYNSILEGNAADSLLTPLTRYEDIFLSTESLTNCQIICIYDTMKLPSETPLLTNPRV